MITRRTALAGAALVATALVGVAGASPQDVASVPNQFASYAQLERWSNDCSGGGFCTKFQVRWQGMDPELYYPTRTGARPSQPPAFNKPLPWACSLRGTWQPCGFAW